MLIGSLGVPKIKNKRSGAIRENTKRSSNPSTQPGDHEIGRYNICKPMSAFTNDLTQRIWKRITAVPAAVKIVAAE